jgi:5'-3' exonuclease
MNLVIDGNSFLSVSTSIVKNILREDKRVGEMYWVKDLMNDGDFMLKEQAKREFTTFTLRYLSSITSIFSRLESFQMVFDSASWRKTYVRDAFSALDDDVFAYKGQRKYDEYQYLFYNYFQQELVPLMETTKLLTFRIPGAEGDDIIARIIESQPNSDYAIWSTDLDFFQLLEDGKRKVILISPKMGKTTKTVYTVKGFKKAEVKAATFDIFNLNMQAEAPDLIKELQQKGFEHVEIDPKLELLEKILAGDKSDHIPRIHKSMTPKKVEALVAELAERFPNAIRDIDTNKENFVMHVMDSVKAQGKVKDEEIETVTRNLHININIIRLRSQFFPTTVTESIDKGLNRYAFETFNNSKFKNIVHAHA